MDFSKAGELMKVQQEAMKIKKEIENTFIEAEVNGLVITISGELKVEKVEFENESLITGLNKDQIKKLEGAIKEAFNKGVTKNQEITNEKMKGVMAKMGMGNLGM